MCEAQAMVLPSCAATFIVNNICRILFTPENNTKMFDINMTHCALERGVTNPHVQLIVLFIPIQ